MFRLSKLRPLLASSDETLSSIKYESKNMNSYATDIARIGARAMGYSLTQKPIKILKDVFYNFQNLSHQVSNKKIVLDKELDRNRWMRLWLEHQKQKLKDYYPSYVPEKLSEERVLKDKRIKL